MNKKQDQRDKLLFKTSIVPYGNGIARFQQASLDTVQELVALNYLRLEEKQSNSPTTQDYIRLAQELIKSYPRLAQQIYFHGYVIDSSREDYRTTLEGMGINCGMQDITNDLKLKLKAFFRGADQMQFDNGEFFCWYD